MGQDLSEHVCLAAQILTGCSGKTYCTSINVLSRVCCASSFAGSFPVNKLRKSLCAAAELAFVTRGREVGRCRGDQAVLRH